MYPLTSGLYLPKVDHIYEVRVSNSASVSRVYNYSYKFHYQYFAAVFLHTIAEVIAAGEDFYPEIADISFAVIIVNHWENLRSIPKDFHKFKTKYFTPGNTNRELLSGLVRMIIS